MFWTLISCGWVSEVLRAPIRHAYLEALVQDHDSVVQFLLVEVSSTIRVGHSWVSYHVGDDTGEQETLLMLVRALLYETLALIWYLESTILTMPALR